MTARKSPQKHIGAQDDGGTVSASSKFSRLTRRKVSVGLRAQSQVVGLAIYYNQFLTQLTKNTIKWAIPAFVEVEYGNVELITAAMTTMTSIPFREWAMYVQMILSSKALLTLLGLCHPSHMRIAAPYSNTELLWRTATVSNFCTTCKCSHCYVCSLGIDFSTLVLSLHIHMLTRFRTLAFGIPAVVVAACMGNVKQVRRRKHERRRANMK